MLHHGRFSIFPLVFMLIALTLSLALSCCDSPTAPGPTVDNGLNGSGTIDPTTSGSFLLGEVSDSSVAPGGLQVWAMNVAFTESTGIATFDVQILNHTHRTLSLPLRFVITSIRPDDIAVVDFDGVTGDEHPFYVFDQKLGGGDVLEPGEWTERVTMKFHTVTARSFAIGFRLDIGPAPGTGTIAGVVFHDGNENGVRDRCGRCNEFGIPGITVALERTLENGDMVTLLARTDSAGEYRFAGLREGVHKVFVVAPEDRWRVTSSNPLLVTLIKGAGGKVQDFFGADFGLFPLLPPLTNLFGPIIVGPFSRFGAELDSTFVNPPSPLTVIFNYYVDVTVPPYMMPIVGIVDSARAWINGEMIFEYVRTMPPDTAYFGPQTIKLRDGLVNEGENSIRLLTAGEEHAALMWRVYKKP